MRGPGAPRGPRPGKVGLRRPVGQRQKEAALWAPSWGAWGAGWGPCLWQLNIALLEVSMLSVLQASPVKALTKCCPCSLLL